MAVATAIFAEYVAQLGQIGGACMITDSAAGGLRSIGGGQLTARLGFGHCRAAAAEVI